MLGDSFGEVCVVSSRVWKTARQPLAFASHSLACSLPSLLSSQPPHNKGFIVELGALSV